MNLQKYQIHKYLVFHGLYYNIILCKYYDSIAINAQHIN